MIKCPSPIDPLLPKTSVLQKSSVNTVAGSIKENYITLRGVHCFFVAVLTLILN